MKNTKTIIVCLFGIFVSILVYILFNKEENKTNLYGKYAIYLNTTVVGYTKNKNDLEKYINNLPINKSLKEKYRVDNIYLPTNVRVEKKYSINNNVDSLEEIYNKINTKTYPTIDAIEVTVFPEKVQALEYSYTTPKIKFYVINKDILKESIEKFVKLFTTEEEYKQNFTKLSSNNKNVAKIRLVNNIKVVNKKIEINKKIYDNSNDLSKMLIFGEKSNTTKHIVQPGESLEKIADTAKISVKELLLVNSNIFNNTTDTNVLLYPGQEINTSYINPALVVEKNFIEDLVVDKKYDMLVEYDKSKTKGYSFVKRDGVDGKLKLISEKTYRNNIQIHAKKILIQTLKEPINKIVVKGTKTIPGIADNYWKWPTIGSPALISSYYGYREFHGGNFHEGIDIPTYGMPAPIFAANNGIVVEVVDGIPARYRSCSHKLTGNHVYINHRNGLYTAYLHMTPGVLVKTGEVVEKGQLLGYTGGTGCSTAIHLHFGLHRTKPYSSGNIKSESINPMVLFR